MWAWQAMLDVLGGVAALAIFALLVGVLYVLMDPTARKRRQRRRSRKARALRKAWGR